MICAPRYWWISGNNPFTQQQTPAGEGETAGWLCGSLTVELQSHSGLGRKGSRSSRDTAKAAQLWTGRAPFLQHAQGCPRAAGEWLCPMKLDWLWALTKSLPVCWNTAAAAAKHNLCHTLVLRPGLAAAPGPSQKHWCSWCILRENVQRGQQCCQISFLNSKLAFLK